MDEVKQDHVGQQGKVEVNEEEYRKVLKKYKKIKKYMKSSIFAVKTMDETEELVSGLIKEAEQNSGNEI
tara:strand:- start:23483 stop:23689 length:207 start_codon:yes stop_codon:yes gene_type:complete